MARATSRKCPACGKTRKFRVDVKTCGCQGTNPRLTKKQSEKPVIKGTIHGLSAETFSLPKPGQIKRYIITAAQNNTYVHEGVWKNILALVKHYDAELLIGTISYDQNSHGRMSVKRDKYKGGDREPWYDERVKPYFKDERVQLGAGLVWCGEANIIPTAGDPLRGFETYSGRQSSIFPHAKIAMRSVASIQGSGAKLMYTTGTVTQRNYIQKRAGLIAEFHHTYGGLIVEVDSRGVWKVRQLDAEDDTGTIYDLTLKAENGKVTGGHRAEAVTWGDLHGTALDPTVLELAATGRDNMLDGLRPKYQFVHDLIEGVSVNHHDARKPLERFRCSLRGMTVLRELEATAAVFAKYHRPYTQTIVVNSNHDRWLDRWLDSFDARFDDARNAEIYHDGNAARYQAVREGKENFVVMEYLLRKHAGYKLPAKFLGEDESFLICDRRIECGLHGDRGANGSRGSSAALSKIGRRSNTGHTHVTGIWDGAYVAGTSTLFRMGYNHGPSSWTHSHVITYANGKRCIITMFDGKWKA